MGTGSRVAGPQRAQSSTIGLVLVIGMVIIATTTVIVVGGVAIEDSREQLGASNAENAMTQLDSQASLVALGNSDRQQVDLGAASADDYRVDGSAGSITVDFENPDGSTTQLLSRSMGAVVYDGSGPNDEVAYQGGGVWRSDGDGSVMVSPPEFHYRDETLTMPIVTVNGEETLSDSASITRTSTTRHYPDPPASENPLEAKNLRITVQSQYYEAWGTYFEERTEGTVSYDDSNQEVTIVLEPPFEGTFDNAVATTRDAGITWSCCNPDSEDEFEEGVNHPSADSRIDNQINECQTGSSCDTSEPTTITSAGTYYYSGSYTNPDSLTVDSPGGDVTVVVNGDFNPRNIFLNGISSDNSVTILVKGKFTMKATGGGDRYNSGGNPEELRVLVYSDNEVVVNGGSGIEGVVYAPGSECTWNGGASSVTPNIEGAMICETATIKGNPNDFEHDSSVEDIDFGLGNSDTVRLQYLHVTTSEIEVTNG